MRKFIAVLLTLLMCICFFGCGKNQIETSDSISGAVSEKTVSETEKNGKTESTSSVTGAAGVTDTHSDQNGTTVENTEAITEKNVSTTVPATNSVSTAVTTTVKETTEQPIPREIKCTVKIECTKILENQNKFSDDISLVPPNGVILEATTVTVTEGATVYDALKKVCSQNGITLNEKNSMFGKYIAGINGIDEKDCGAYSGWLYSVNGTSPNVGVSSYKLRNGDSIVLSYTC